MIRACLAAFAVTALPFGALADPVSSGPPSGDPPSVSVQGRWGNGTAYDATAEVAGDNIRLLISENGNPIVDNYAFSEYWPGEGSAFELTSDTDGSLLLVVHLPYGYGGARHQEYRMYLDEDEGAIQVSSYEVTETGRDDAVPGFRCRLDLVDGHATIESYGNQIPSPFTGVPADRTTAEAWTERTNGEISGCIAPG
ncbi:MAG: hypothetical protein Q4G26_00860 [Paracoccus sp. (in: a-proteobacteria)]|nr:hypothetical protein [Paracoccus sp. (in: a-proteobacteria)]